MATTESSEYVLISDRCASDGILFPIMKKPVSTKADMMVLLFKLIGWPEVNSEYKMGSMIKVNRVEDRSPPITTVASGF